MNNKKKFRYNETNSFKMNKTRKSNDDNRSLNVKITVSITGDEDTLVDFQQNLEGIMAIFDTASLSIENMMDEINLKKNKLQCERSSQVQVTSKPEYIDEFYDKDGNLKINSEESAASLFHDPNDLESCQRQVQLDTKKFCTMVDHYINRIKDGLYDNDKEGSERDIEQILEQFKIVFREVDFIQYKTDIRSLYLKVWTRYILISRIYKKLKDISPNDKK